MRNCVSGVIVMQHFPGDSVVQSLCFSLNFVCANETSEWCDASDLNDRIVRSIHLRRRSLEREKGNCKQSTEHVLSVLCVIAFQVVRLYERMYGELLSSAVHVTMEIVWLLYHTHVTCKFNPIKGSPNKDIMIGSTSSYWKWKDGPMVACVAGGLGRVATKGREAGSFAKSLPAPLHFSLFCSFSVSPLPKSNMAPKQTFHRIHEDRQLRRLLQVFARVNWAFVSQSSPCWFFFSRCF